MRIAFLDSPERDYTVLTVGEKPLGGTQTAVSYVSRGLAKLGHEIILFRGTNDSGVIDGVRHLASSKLTLEQLRSLSIDVIVLISSTGEGRRIRSIQSGDQRLVLWAHTPDDQANYAALRDAGERDSYDGFAFVSKWQAEQFQKAFGIDARRSGILRNAAGPEFHGLFGEGENIVAAKVKPPVLVYTSAPNRGLSILLRAFPSIRDRIPGARLQVFSSLRLYDASAEEDQREFGKLYDLCRGMEGVEYVGVLPQGKLAERLRSASVLAYPCATEETSCIAAMEAMAAGCFVVTTAGGGLPETTAGFASLIPAGLVMGEYVRLFVEAVVERVLMEPGAAEEFLQGQRRFAGENYGWGPRAGEWEVFLSSLRQR
jgi:glycosyltransferase involved in cell wall biosynthesis